MPKFVRVWRIFGSSVNCVSGASTFRTSGSVLFAGRREELATLPGGLDEVLETGESVGGVALVTGVPGIGLFMAIGRELQAEG